MGQDTKAPLDNKCDWDDLNIFLAATERVD